MSTTLPHGIIQINEGNISWYGDITANWQLIDSKIGIYDAAVASIPAPANNGTLTINYGGTTLAMFGADNAGNVTADIPAPGDGTLTITVNGTPAGAFSANQSTNATANITVPTAVSELTNDSGYLTSSSNLDASKLTSGTVDIERLPQGALERLVKVANEAARYALTTADVQLGDTVQQLDTGIMYVVTDIDHLDSAAGYTEYTAGTAASVPWSGVTGKPTFAAVATSGAYSDLTGTPTIPTVNDATLTIQQNGTNVATFTANASSNVTADITVPTKTSELTNDSGFLTSADRLPVGSYIQFAGSQAPEGFLVCNGGEISRTTYGALFAVIGTTYGSGDGSTTFNLPNLTDRFLQGSTGVGTVKNAGLPNIEAAADGMMGLDAANGAFYVANMSSGNQPNASGYHGLLFDASRSNSIYGNSSTVQPPALTCLICIKY